jgi:membrane-bound lytic murein transglycosylase B
MRPCAAAIALATLLALAPGEAPAAQRRALHVDANRDAAAPASYALRADAMRFADEIAQRHGFDLDWTRDRLAQARFVPAVARLIMPAPTPAAKDWAAYRERFVNPQRVDAGIAFWVEHERWLVRAQALYGVPPQIVVGIIGVETFFGRHTGKFRVIDALATLAFDFPSGARDRSGFFRDELEALFVLGRAQGIDPLDVRGSYAGAIGLPQFMPSSWNRHAVDFDGDGKIDLQNSVADVIGSVANYLATFGWQVGLPARYEVIPPGDLVDRAVLLAPDIVPSFTAAEFAERGAMLDDAGQKHQGLLALVLLHNGDQPPSYVAGTANFYSITRYNRSAYYALAVIELGEAIARMRPGRFEPPAADPPPPDATD